MTTAKPTVVEALSAVMDDVRSVSKTERNTTQNFNFRGIDAVMNAVGPALRTHRVVVVPTVTDYHQSTVMVGRDARPMMHMVVEVTYRFHGPNGDHLDAAVIGESFDAGDKAVAKAMSVAFRTCLLQALCLPTDEPDPDHGSYERADGDHDPAKVSRSGAPDDDPWATASPTPPPDRDRGSWTSGRAAASTKQLGMIGKLMTERGMTDREAALEFVNNLIAPQGPVTSRADLTKAQASQLIDALQALPIPTMGEWTGD